MTHCNLGVERPWTDSAPHGKKHVSHDTVIYTYLYDCVCALFLLPRANAEAEVWISVQRGQKCFIIPRYKEKYVETKHLTLTHRTYQLVAHANKYDGTSLYIKWDFKLIIFPVRNKIV